MSQARPLLLPAKMRTSLVAETASRLIKEGKLTVANVDGGRLQTGRERSLAYVKTNTIVDRKMNALEVA